MLDLLILMTFVVYSLTVGFRARRVASKDLGEYFLAGQTLKGWRAGVSMAATQFAADTPLLVTGLLATAGIFALWRLWIYGIAFLLMAFLFSAYWRRAEVLTDAELTELGYSGRGVLFLRALKAVYYGTVINCAVLAMVLVAAVRIAEVFLPWHLWLPPGLYDPLLGFVELLGVELASGALDLPTAVATTNNLISIGAIVVFTTLYSATGGLRGVVATDVAQFVLAMAGTLAYAWVVTSQVGGLDGLSDRVVELYSEATAGRLLSFTPGPGVALVPFLAVVGLQWLFQMNSDGTGYLAQRSMACESAHEARIAGVVFAWLQVVLRSLLWLVIAVGLLVLYPFAPGEVGAEGFAAAREMTFVMGADELLPAGARGLLLTGLLAALASTIDTHLNWGASYWSNDLYGRLVNRAWLGRTPGERELVIVARISNFVILGIALTLMVNLGSIQQAWLLTLLFGAGMGGVLVLRWIWERINLYSELAAVASSLLLAPVLLATVDQEWARLVIMALGSTGIVVVVTLMTPPTDASLLGEFYRRVQPAGWWRRTAILVGGDPIRPVRELRRGLTLTALTSASLFMVLVGSGSLLVPGPGSSKVLSIGLVVLGLALVPGWLPGLLRSRVTESAAD